MRVLLVDDSLVKISSLTKAIIEEVEYAEINSTGSIVNTIEKLRSENRFDLLVVDLELPLRSQEKPRKDGGKFLLSEINRKIPSEKLPRYILGCTQFSELLGSFSDIWSTLIYSPADSHWKKSIKDKLNYISKISSEFKNEIIKPTLFLEGVTDKLMIETAIEYYYPDKKNCFDISTGKDAGANWVANQIAIWALSLKKNSDGEYIQSLGLLDSDEAGNKAKATIKERINTNNESSTFKIVQIKPSYNLECLEFYKKGCKIELEIESLFPSSVLNLAKKNNWLEHRSSTFIDNPREWKQFDQTSLQYVASIGIPAEYYCYLMKVKREKKIDFSKYVCSLEKEFFINFKPLLIDIFDNLKI